MLVLYVDDLLVTARHMSDLNKFWSKLAKWFKIKTIYGQTQVFLGNVGMLFTRAWIDLAISMLFYLGYIENT